MHNAHVPHRLQGICCDKGIREFRFEPSAWRERRLSLDQHRALILAFAAEHKSQRKHRLLRALPALIAALEVDRQRSGYGLS
jgi:hypothetical protein